MKLDKVLSLRVNEIMINTAVTNEIAYLGY